MAQASRIHGAGGHSFRRRFHISSPFWLGFAGIVGVVFATPLLVILAQMAFPDPEIWSHLWNNVLGHLVTNTAILLACIIPITSIIGIGLGWLTSACEYPGRSFFSWAFVLPFAIPPYVFAFVYLGLFDFSGPVQTYIRDIFPGIGFIDIRNGFGVSSILSLAFYPYVYLMSRSAFMTQGKTALEAARTLGLSPVKAFFTVSLPMARPFIATGMILVCMESLADFGAVSIFNYDTFTTAIYKSWFGLFSLQSAAQLSSILALFVLSALIFEKHLRKRIRFTEAGKPSRSERMQLGPLSRWTATGICTVFLFLSFILPCAQLVYWAAETLTADDWRFITYGINTLLLAAAGAFATTAIAILLTFARREAPGPAMNVLTRLSTLGYALPGTVLAVGIFLPASWLDHSIVNVADTYLGISISPFLQGSLGVMIVGYCVRFLAAGHGSVDSAMERISPSIIEAAKSLGVTGTKLLAKVYLPLLNKGIFAGALLVFVDIMKEMPITLMMRPFGWDTLAVKIFEYTSEGEWELAAIPSITLIIAGLIPVFMLTRQGEK